MPMIHAERRSLAEFLDTLSPEQWTTPTWCDKWNVQELVGHLTAAGNITAPHFFGGFIRTGFNFDKFVEGDLRKYAAGYAGRRARALRRDHRQQPHAARPVVRRARRDHGARRRHPPPARRARRASGRAPHDARRGLQEDGRAAAGEEAARRLEARGHRRRLVDRRRPRGPRPVHVVDPRRWSAAPARSTTAKAPASRRCGLAADPHAGARATVAAWAGPG